MSRTIALGYGVSLDSGDCVTERRGRWYAGAGRLALQWEDGGAEYAYRVEGFPGARRLVFSDGARAVLWEEARPGLSPRNTRNALKNLNAKGAKGAKGAT